MVAFWLIGYLILSGSAVTLAVLLVAQAWEHRRYTRSRLRWVDEYHPSGRVMVLAPCKDIDVSLEENLRRLFDQDYDDYEITFIVQSISDPAYDLISRLMAEETGVRSRLVVSGRAEDCGQKVHNLRVATTRLPQEVKYLVFVDSDAQPRRDWLRVLIARLDRKGIGAATSYRWFVPSRPTLANHLLYSINCGVTMLFGAAGPNLVWGGSWAIRRRVFESIGLRQEWKGTLSDDLVASRVLRRHRLHVDFEPACMVASPLDGGRLQACSFLRRQYVIGRSYIRNWWAIALLIVTLSNLALWVNLAAAACCLATGTAWGWLPAGVSAVLYGLNAFRAWVRQDLIRLCFPRLQNSLRAARRFDIWAGPLVGLVNWIGLIGSILGRRINWRGIVYRLCSGGRTEIVRRLDDIPPPASEWADSQETPASPCSGDDRLVRL